MGIFNWKKFPYTNFHELNLDYFINKFNEIFSEWENLYNTLNTWKDDTTTELEAWKTATTAELEAWETDTLSDLNAWKYSTELDISAWETATLSALNAWKTATEAVFEQIRTEAAASATAAAGSATDAETAKTAAQTAQAAAEAAAESVSESAVQIARNANDIENIKNCVLINKSSIYTWEQGSIRPSNGEDLDSSITIRTDSFYRYDKPVYISVPSGYKIACRLYDNTYSYTDYIDWKENDFLLNSTPGYYYRLIAAYVTNANILPDASSEIDIYIFTDSTLELNGKAADAKTVGNELINIKEILKGSNIRAYKWGIIGSESYPTGYRAGYFDNSGDAQNSAYYIRTRGAINAERGISKNDFLGIVTPPNGYAVRVTEKDSSLNFVRNIGNFSDIDKKVVFEINPNNTYYFSIGRFDNADAENYLTSEFTNSCIFNIYSKNNTFEQPEYTTTFIFDSEKKYAIKLPDKYSSQNTIDCIILCHGLSSSISASYWDGYNDVGSKFIEQGFAVIDVDKVTTQDWCNPDLIKRYVAAINDAKEKYNINIKYIYGYSMGSLIALWLASYYNICAIAIGGPRLDFEARYNAATAEEKTIINSNLGFTNGFDKYIAAGWDKVGYGIEIDTSTFLVTEQFKPLYLVYGSSDTGETSTRTETISKEEAIKRGGTTIVSKEYTGDHSNVCHLTAGTSFNDVLNWFNTWK